MMCTGAGSSFRFSVDGVTGEGRKARARYSARWWRAGSRLAALVGRVAVPQSDGVNRIGAGRLRLLQASSRDDHELLCRNRCVIGMIERGGCGCEREDRPRGEGG